MIAYKGFNKDMTCRGFQFEEGKTYEEDSAELCRNGFHACEMPLNVFEYYVPGSSVYHRVELEDVSPERKEDSKVCAKKIKIGARLSIGELVKLQAEYVKDHTTTEHTDPKRATAGDYGASTAGNYGASTAGDSGAATSRGSSASGNNGVSVARGTGVWVKGGLGAVLVIAEECRDSYDISAWKAAVVDGKAIKPDTWYKLKNGEFVEA